MGFYDQARRSLSEYLSPLSELPASDRRYLLVFLTALPNGIILNFMNAIVFYILDIPINYIINIFHVLIYAFIQISFSKNIYLTKKAAFVLIHVILPIQLFIMTYYIGAINAPFLFVILSPILAFLEPSLSFKQKIALAVWGCVIFILGMIYLALHEPLYHLTAGWFLYFVVIAATGLAFMVTALIAVYAHAVVTAENELEIQYNRAENLLRNILPDEIAARLKTGEKTIADEHNEVSVLFADIVDFTKTASNMHAAELVDVLNRIFSEFDKLCDKHEVEKIKTIGDAYMVVAGLPSHREDHAIVLARLALEMHTVAERVSSEAELPLRFRIGINSGPVVAGVIGTRKFAYDLWGDTVNVASRMEELGQPGVVYVTERTRELLGDAFGTESVGELDVKGKGLMQAYAMVV